jgi:DNA-binding NtrC family response regulator
MTAHDQVQSADDLLDAALPLPRSTVRNVLIVEDDRRLRDLLQTSIREMDLNPTPASSAEMALRLVSQQVFAVAVIDLNLPGMSGLELCQQLHREKPTIQLIILTGFGDLDAARQAIRMEVIDFLTKPCGMDDLEQALGRAGQRWLQRWPTQPPAPPPEPSAPSVAHEPPASASGPMDEMERELILASLSRHGGNRQAAAQELGISVRKLYYRLHQYQQQGLSISEK